MSSTAGQTREARDAQWQAGIIGNGRGRKKRDSLAGLSKIGRFADGGCWVGVFVWENVRGRSQTRPGGGLKDGKETRGGRQLDGLDTLSS